MGLYYTKPEEKSLLYNRPIEEAFGTTPKPTTEKPKVEPKEGELSVFLRAALDGIMFAKTSKEK